MPISKLTFFIFLLLFHFANGSNATAAKVDVGIILDLQTPLGKMYKTCISMAIEDFYFKNSNYSTVIVPHFKDSSKDVVSAASAAIDLLKNTQVVAIWGPQTSIQADFVIEIGDKVEVPIVSPATSLSLSPHESPYLIRSSWCFAFQAKAIAAVVKNFGWREVFFIYEDTKYGSGLVQFLAEELLNSNSFVSSRNAVSPSAENDEILQQLNEIKKKLQAKVFVVHMLPSLASRFFQMAKEAGMMSKGYAWIVADPLTSLLDSEGIEAMQGVIGVKAYIPKSDEVISFVRRWKKRFYEENPEIERPELNVFGLWAYDSIAAVAESVERVRADASPRFKNMARGGGSIDLEAIGTSNSGPKLAPLIRNFMSKGLSGDYNISDGQLQPSEFEIVNVIGNGVNTVGFWTVQNGVSKDLAIIWPGKTTIAPNGLSGSKLRVGVPINRTFDEFVKVEKDEDGVVKATGFCIDVFEEALQSLAYGDGLAIEYIAFEVENYDDLVYQIFLQNIDAVVGDVTITNIKTKNAWIFMKPLTLGLWLTIGAFCIFTGFVVWVLEHRENTAFAGPAMQQLGTTLWFSFSTLVFSHKENVTSNLTRFVVIVWLFVVLVLTSSYNANLTSMLTVQQLKSIDMIKKGEYIGHKNGSLITGFLKGSAVFNNYNLRYFGTIEQYEDALSKGSRNGGAAAIVDEIPYLKLVLGKHCDKYTMIDPIYKTSGFGFAFRKGSPLVGDVSIAILEMKENGKMDLITRRWFGAQVCCADGLEGLGPDRFTGLFLIAGVSSSMALAAFFSEFFYENRDILASSASVKEKLQSLARAFVERKDEGLTTVGIEMQEANNS
ncbi:glutamate receptor 2.9-like isoform X2 [Salvia hispanica]|uniref:glutamate receptor 2.9-like isoform X2 n=1 Tax=Salvia hispanica TaxID=49212 RepID=UPI0020097A16|nr:glutamate receptor 2.9-like isoform X2 [Salvia hispanica]